MNTVKSHTAPKYHPVEDVGIVSVSLLERGSTSQNPPADVLLPGVGQYWSHAISEPSPGQKKGLTKPIYPRATREIKEWLGGRVGE